MKLNIVAASALIAGSSLQAQTVATATLAPPVVDLSTTSPADGTWVYAAVTGGSAATFSSAATQLVVSCARASRQVAISRSASGAAPFILVWTSAQSRNLPASYNPATSRLNASVSAFDPLLDAIAFSRGRAGFSAPNQPTLVVPAWAEVARVVEDCRA